MYLYIIETPGGYYLKEVNVNGNNTVTATFSKSMAQAKVYLNWNDANDDAVKVGGTLVPYKKVVSE